MSKKSLISFAAMLAIIGNQYSCDYTMPKDNGSKAAGLKYAKKRTKKGKKR